MELIPGHLDLMTVLQVGVGERPQPFELGAVDEDLVAGGEVDLLAPERDTTQPAVAASSLPVDICVVPVDDLPMLGSFQIHEVDAPMAVTLV
ncbi:MAG TPA: hypothetical protein VMM13_12940, partial [Euzebya sp.]|nr:hypothetical protein [Euzebya sp.]